MPLSSSSVGTLLIVVEVLSALGVLAAAVAAFRSAHRARETAEATRAATEATREAAQGQLLHGLLREFKSPTMARDLTVLKIWFRHVGEAECAERLVVGLEREEPAAQCVADAERRVLQSFEQLVQLLRLGLLAPNAFATFCDGAAAAVLLRIVHPIELALIDSTIPVPGGDDTERLGVFSAVREHSARYREAVPLADIDQPGEGNGRFEGLCGAELPEVDAAA